MGETMKFKNELFSCSISVNKCMKEWKKDNFNILEETLLGKLFKCVFVVSFVGCDIVLLPVEFLYSFKFME
jgi:hypothetical protein